MTKLILFSAFIFMALTTSGHAQESIFTDRDLRADILSDSNNIARANAIDYAVAHKRANVLVDGLNHRSWDVKGSVITAMASLPAEQAKASLRIVLEKNDMWVDMRNYGGEIAIVQKVFLKTVQKAIRQVYGLDASTTDLFDVQGRADMLAKMNL